MGLFSFLSKKKAPKISVSVEFKESPNEYVYEPSEASKLLQKATEMKQKGDIGSAVECLREAYKEIAKGSMNYGIDPFLRLPMYLQAAGKSEEAWLEFNRLLTKGYPNQMRDKDLFPMEASIVYDKMRLFLEREGKKDAAVRYGVTSHMYWAIGLHMQDRMEELKEHIAREALEKKFGSLLKRAKEIQKLDAVISTFMKYVDQIPNVELERLSNAVDEIVLKMKNNSGNTKQNNDNHSIQ